MSLTYCVGNQGRGVYNAYNWAARVEGLWHGGVWAGVRAVTAGDRCNPVLAGWECVRRELQPDPGRRAAGCVEKNTCTFDRVRPGRLTMCSSRAPLPRHLIAPDLC